MDPKPITFDVSEAVGEPAQLAGSYFAAGGPAGDRPLLVCLPGGTYTRGYWDLQGPGHSGYSFARAAAGEGFPVVTLDSLGTGESTRPARDIEMTDQAAAAAASAVAQIPEVLGIATPAVAVGHSMGGYVSMLQQAAFGSYAGLAILGTTNGAVGQLGLPPEMIEAAATPEGRAALVDQMAAGMPDPYLAGDRAPLRSWFHLADVPDELIAADEAATLTVVPRRCAAGSSVPGHHRRGRGRRHRAGAARLRRGRRLHRPPRRARVLPRQPRRHALPAAGQRALPQPGRHPAPPLGPPAVVVRDRGDPDPRLVTDR